MASEAFYVYVHARPDLTPFYVGKGTAARARLLKPRNAHYCNVLSKIGRENVVIEMHRCASEAEAFLREQLVIKSLRVRGVDLTNRTDGGEGVGGHIHSEEAWLAISDAGRGRPVSPETRRRISEAHSGKRLTQEHRGRLSLAWKSRPPMSDETRAKISAGHRLRPPPSEETRLKISLAKRGVPQTRNRKDDHGR